jgi:hypothetical protein
MDDFDLRPLRADAATTAPRLLEDFDPAAPREELVRVGAELVLRFHLLAAGSLLVDADAAKFFLHLSRCAENGLRLLQLLARRGLEPLPASQDVPLLAALAAGDRERAAAIVQHSAHRRDEAAREYEDEFLWARAIQLLAAPAGDRRELGEALARLEALELAGYRDRVAVARAIEARDGGALGRAIGRAAQAYGTATEKRAAAFGTPVTRFAPHRHLWLEGLALLRLGERAGLRVEGQLRYCPRLARGEMTEPYQGDFAIEIG